MTTLKPQRAPGETLAGWAWAAVALTPVGWFYGFLAIAYSHLGDVTDVSMMTGGVVLFVIAPTSAFILAVYAARAGHRSGKIAVIVSGLLLLATLVVLTLVFWWVGLPVTAVVAVLVLAWVRSRRIAVAVSGLLLLAILAFSGWLSGGWINVAVIAVMAVVTVLVFAWARSRNKPPPGPDGAQGEERAPPQKPRLRRAGIAVRFRLAGLAACAGGWSAPASAKHGEQHQNEGGDGQDAVGDDDRQREVPFGRDSSSPGKRRAGVTEGAVHADPARRHDQAQNGDGAQDGDRGPGQPLLI